MTAPTAESLETVVDTLTITQGSILDKLITVSEWTEDPDTGLLTRTRANLTGGAVWLSVIRIAPTPETQEIIKKGGAGGNPLEIALSVQAGDTLGQARVFFLAADTESLAPTDGSVTNYTYEVHVQLVGGNREPVIDESPFVVVKRRMPAYT